MKLAIVIIRSILAVVLGYGVFVLGAFIAQESILGGVSYRDSSLLILLAAGILTPWAAVLGGAVTALVAPVRPFAHLWPMTLLIVAETSYLYLDGRVDGPLWFEAGAGASLVVGAWLGGAAVVFAKRHVLRPKAA